MHIGLSQYTAPRAVPLQHHFTQVAFFIDGLSMDSRGSAYVKEVSVVWCMVFRL
jgi:hypothetical protein